MRWLTKVATQTAFIFCPPRPYTLRKSAPQPLACIAFHSCVPGEKVNSKYHQNKCPPSGCGRVRSGFLKRYSLCKCARGHLFRSLAPIKYRVFARSALRSLQLRLRRFHKTFKISLTGSAIPAPLKALNPLASPPLGASSVVCQRERNSRILPCPSPCEYCHILTPDCITACLNALRLLWQYMSTFGTKLFKSSPCVVFMSLTLIFAPLVYSPSTKYHE